MSEYTGWHRVSDDDFHMDSECIEDAGEIALEVEGVTHENGQEYELMPGTTEFTWSMDGLLDGYDYELYWYRAGSYYESHYEYFSADSTGTASHDFDTIDEHECNVYFYAYLRPLSDITGNYEDVDYYSFHPQSPCVPVFGLVAADDDGNMTVDAMNEDFALSPGWNDLAIDLSGMGEGSSYYVEWYYEDSNSWNGWFYDDLSVNASDPDSYMLHFEMWMGDMDCDAHLYARVVNTTDGQWDEMGGYDVYIGVMHAADKAGSAR